MEKKILKRVIIEYYTLLSSMEIKFGDKIFVDGKELEIVGGFIDDEGNHIYETEEIIHFNLKPENLDK